VAFDIADEHAQADEALTNSLDSDRNTDINDTMSANTRGPVFHRELSASLCTSYDVIVLSPGVPRTLPCIVAAIESGVVVVGDVALFASAAQGKPLIAVTGSNGKSTVVTWLGHVLEACGRRAVVCGNIGLPVLDSLLGDEEVDNVVYVLELSSYQLESTCNLQATSAVVLNVSDDHMDRYDSIEHYAAVKRVIYQHVQHCVFNRDDDRTVDASNTAASQQYFSVSKALPGDCQLAKAANDDWLSDGESNIVQLDALQMPGQHNVANALAVIALLMPFELNSKQLACGLIAFRGLPHRTEFIGEYNGVRWYNDSKGTNIDACKKALEAMQAPIVLIAGGQGKGADFSALNKTVEQHVKALVLIGEDREIIASTWQNLAPIHRADDLHEAVQLCDQLSEKGDVVLLSPACASFDMFDNFEQRGEQFCREVEALVA